MTTTDVLTIPKIAPLTASDRCDRCGAQAYVAARLAPEPGKGVLLFCMHDWKAMRDVVAPKAYEIREEPVPA